VLEKGQTVDIGPHTVLLDRCDVYRQLWSQQNRHMQKSTFHATFAPTLVDRS
jgi:subfamily B ATP-binding cassette protein HlyB/CyaB